ncbi:MAG: putative Ig domain-containing protein, partial [Bryobacterales bacterium]|nr:putative Ig domain-containing protein [Bryobacterales bacterium]
DSLGAIFDRQFTITIGGGTGSTLSIVTTTLPNGAVGAFYTQTLQATGGMGSYQWTSEGTLPPGLGVSAGGQLFGTPTTGGTYSFNVRVADGGGSNATRPLSLTIGGSGLTITTPSLPGASLGTPYTTTLQASGGTGQLVWTLTAGQLPPGIGLTNSTGALAGTPTVPGNYTFTVQVADTAGGRATRELTLTVNSGLTITTTALPGGSAGQAYSFTMTAAGGSGTGFVWSITAGTLPVGLTMTTGGLISGTPTTNGTSNFTVQVVDSTLQTATRQLSITIGSTLTVVTQTLPNGQLGVAYNQTVTAAGATGAVQWSVVGSLPPGLTLNAATGAIAGSPTQNGIYNFSLRVQDATLASAQRAFTIIIGDSFSITTPTALPNAIEGVAYSQALAASGGQAPYTWTLSVGVLPAGLSLTPSSGLISGTPTTVGSFSFIIQVTDATQQTVTKAFTLAIGGRLSILTPSQLPPGSVRAPYRETLSATGGIAPYNWTLLNGALPIGVTLTTGGELNGTPTNAGLFTFTAQVTDGANATATRTFTLNVALALSITTASPLPAGTAGVAYVQTVSATGGLAPYTFSLTTGALPTGLTLNSQGILAGTPTAAGSFNFTVQVSDANRGTATANMALTVRLPSPPSVLLSGLSESVEAAQQPRLSVSLGAPYPAPITGTLTLTFTSDAIVPLDDPAIVFTNGRRTVDFTIPANATSAQLPAGFAMQTGTVSGAIQLAVTNLRSGEQSIMPDPAPSITARLARGAPVVRQVVARRVASGLEVQITGYATTREITQALFRFTPAAGSTLQTTELTIQLGDGARTWYQGEQSRAFGSQFTLTQQFNVQGDTSAISSVTVTLTNAQGTSPAASANFQ